MEDIADLPVLYFNEAAADIQTADASEHALLVKRDVGGTAADIDICNRRAIVLRDFIRARAARRKHAFEVGTGGRDDEVARQIGQGFEHLIRVLLARGLTGDDDRTGLQVARVHARFFIFVSHDLLDALGVDLGRGNERCEINIAAINDFLLYDAHTGHRIAAGQIFHHKPAEDQLGR